MLFDIQNIEYSIKGVHILNAFNLQLEENKSLLLLGPSGCGKTTLMNIMAGLLKPNAGKVSFENHDVLSLKDAQRDKLRAESFGFVFQRFHLIGHLSVEQNIALAQKTADNDRIKELIDDLGLSGKSQQKARDLSVGEAQRVSIARAVVHNPKVIFADEPTSALDDANTQKVMDLIFDQAKKSGASIVAATHDERIKNRFDQVVEMAT